jgi:hypothetical protein
MTRTGVSSLLAEVTIVRNDDKLSGRVWTTLMLMKFPSLPLGAMLLPALAARATDDMQIYSDRLNNMIESN